MSAPEVSRSVRIPADVDREDRVLGNLTARQVAIFAATALVLYGGWVATRAVVPIAAVGAVALPVGCGVIVITLGSRDGISLDRLLFAAVAQRRTPALQLASPGGAAPVPDWVTTHATTEIPAIQHAAPLDVAALRLPREPIADAPTVRAGVIDLGSDGLAVVCSASTVNFALRTVTEQEALVATFGRFLHSLTEPVQIVIAARRLDVSERTEQLRRSASWLPHPALRDAALAHADYLEDLAHQRDLLRRDVLIVLREPIHTPPGAALRLRRAPHAAPVVDGAARTAAETRLGRRVAETAELLAAAGLTITPLGAPAATAILTAACNPNTLTGAGQLADPDAVITGARPEAPPNDADEGLWWSR